jgi:hypothetical protein
VFSIQFIRWYLTTTTSSDIIGTGVGTGLGSIITDDIQQVGIHSFVILYTSLLSLVKAMVALGYLIILVSLKVGTLACPHIAVLGRRVIDFHRTQLTYRELLVEFTCLFLLGMYLLFRRRIAAAWGRFERDLSTKSRMAAKFVPHVLFFTVSGVAAIAGQKFLAPLSSDMMLPVFLLALPVLTTALSLRGCRNEVVVYSRLMRLWIIIATYLSISSLLSLIPFSSVIHRRLIFVREFVVVVTMWLQLSAGSVNIVYESIQPIFHSLMSRLPTVDMDPNKSNFFLRMLVTMRMISPKQELFLRTLFQDGIALVIAASFLFTPFPMVAVVAVGLLLPAYNTSACIDHDKGRSTVAASKGKESKETSKTNYSTERAVKWLQYWVCLGLVWLIKVYIFPGLWSSIQLVICLWLQHSYFRGAAKVFAFAGDSVEAVSTRRSRVPLLTDNNNPLQKLVPLMEPNREPAINQVAEVGPSAPEGIPLKPKTSVVDVVLGRRMATDSVASSVDVIPSAPEINFPLDHRAKDEKENDNNYSNSTKDSGGQGKLTRRGSKQSKVNEVRG